MPENEETINIDPGSLTLGDLEKVEQFTGEPAGKLFSGEFSAKTLVAMVAVVKQRTDPDFTLEDAKAMKISTLNLGGDEDPQPAGADGAS